MSVCPTKTATTSLPKTNIHHNAKLKSINTPQNKNGTTVNRICSVCICSVKICGQKREKKRFVLKN